MDVEVNEGIGKFMSKYVINEVSLLIFVGNVVGVYILILIWILGNVFS